MNPLALAALAGLSLLSSVASPARALETFQDDFSLGLSPANWTVRRSLDLPPYTVDASTGIVRVRRASDAGHAGEQAVWIEFAHPIVGDFSAEVQYHDAALEMHGGGTGNDAALVARFAGQTCAVRRANETGSVPVSQYAWVDPPGFAHGRVATATTAGTMRISRQSILLFLSIDDVTLYTGIVEDDTLRSIAFGLENHGTTDTTSVAFDDFALTAAQILWTAPTDVPDGRATALRLDVAPNPARGHVRVALDLPRADAPRVTVVDVQGRRVALLSDAALPAGRREFAWDAPAALAPGLYFVIAELPGRVLRARVALTR